MKTLPSIILGVAIFVGIASGCTYAQTDVSAPQHQATSPVTEGLQLLLTLKQQTYSADQPVHLDVTMQNTTDKDLPQLYPFEDSAAALNILVRTPEGRSAPLTAYGKDRYAQVDFNAPYLSSEFGHSYSVPRVPAHGALKHHILLSHVYDLSQETAYIVTVKQLIPKLGGKGVAVIESRPLWINITTDGNELAPFITNPAL